MTKEEIEKSLQSTKFKDEEVLTFEKSVIKPRLYIVTFKSGFQTNVRDIHYVEDK